MRVSIVASPHRAQTTLAWVRSPLRRKTGDLAHVVKKGLTGEFRLNLLSTNGQVVATSEAYNSKASAMGGVRVVKSLAADAVVEDQTTKAWADGEAARKAAAAVKKVAKMARKKVTKKAAASRTTS